MTEPRDRSIRWLLLAAALFAVSQLLEVLDAMVGRPVFALSMLCVYRAGRSAGRYDGWNQRTSKPREQEGADT